MRRGSIAAILGAYLLVMLLGYIGIRINKELTEGAKLKRARAKVATAEVDHAENGDRVVAAREGLANALAAHGDDAAALTEYLWLYDDGMKHVSAYRGVRQSFLLREIKDLGEKYPPAIAALRKRRDEAEERLAASQYGAEDGRDFTAINGILDDSTTTLTFFDSLPTRDPRRHVFGPLFVAELVKARRYAEASELRPAKEVLANLNEGAKVAWAPHAESEQLQRQFHMNYAAEGVEALAGSGNINDARKVIRRMLAIDDSPWVRAILLKHLERAGQEKLLVPA